MLQQVAAEIERLLQRLGSAERHARNMRRWRAAARAAGVLVRWHARAVERAYAPGGRGYAEVRDDFEGQRAKIQRTQ
jgi:hypothetical protein